MARIIIDTNFLLIPVQFKVDIFEEFKRIMDCKYTLHIIDKTLVELAKLQQKAKTKPAASVAKLLIKKYKITEITTKDGADVDTLIMMHSKKGDFVATQDIALRARLKRAGIRIITLRKKSFLALV